MFGKRAANALHPDTTPLAKPASRRAHLNSHSEIQTVSPQIPYITLPEIPLAFLTYIPLVRDLFDPSKPPSIKPFGTLVALGVYIGSIVATRHAKERGMDLKKMSEFIFWVVGIGFIGGHVFDAIFYHPDRLSRDPLYLFKLWDGLSSYGGFAGALIGVFAWRFYRRQAVMDMVDTIASAYPLAWVFGRAGCAVVHDHPGRHSDAWFAVRYPMGEGFVGRYDLGLYEMLLSIPMAVAFAILWRRKPIRPIGFYVGWMCVAYAPVRFFLDFLREEEGAGLVGGDPRYGGLTPAQWASVGLLLIGLYFLRMAYVEKRMPAAPIPAAPAALAAGEGDAQERGQGGKESDAAPVASTTRRRKRRRPKT